MSVNPGERKAALSEKRRNLLLVVFESIVGIFLAASVILSMYSGTYEGAGLIALLGTLFFFLAGRRRQLSADIKSVQGQRGESL